jgi:class 3 adenylate cyclase/ABC-type glycerol-3-phosphate transport system substrate-binding protein
MSDLPTGTVTFLFTDIEGSTRLVRQLGARYAHLLSEHQRILRDCFATYRGREIDTQGDSFFAAFARAGDAIACAVEAQRALAAHEWPENEQVRVRMGLHSGEPRATDERYVGFGVHRAARIGAVAHGGQILLSNATRELVEDDLTRDTRLRDLGGYELKDLKRPERLFQVEAEGLQPQFPPLKARRVDRPHRRRSLALLAAVLVVAIAAAAGYWRKTSDESSVGTADDPITIFTPWFRGDPEHQAFTEVLRAFEQTTGLQTATLESGDIARGERAMLGFTSPGFLAELAREGTVKPLASVGVSDELLEEAFGRSWIELATVDGDVYGLPLAATSKSLVWYRPHDFRRAGLKVPRTWADLLAVTRRLERGGRAPWSVGAQDVFTLTDWFENVYIRTQGQWKYDALFAGKLPFDDPSVISTVRRMTTLLKDEYLAGGVEGALASSFPDAVDAVFRADPGADLLMEGAFVGSLALAAVKPTPEPGATIAATPFPTIDASFGNPVVVGGDIISARSEADEVRQLLLYLMSPGAGRIWVSTGTVVSPNKLVPLSAYPNVLVRTAAEQVTSADVVRFDGSDLLPNQLGDPLGVTLQQVLTRPRAAPRLMKGFQRKAARAFTD